ncbi:MAG: OmpA family protein [Campylobacterota bacterium]|nr:OmpA family protein [Campylobacterota bacterium]
MKKLSILATTLLLSSAVHASDYNYEITPLVGMVFPEGNLQLDNQVLVGGEVQINNLTDTIKPELQLLHSLTSEYKGNDAKTAITRIGLNGVYEFDTADKVTPFLKAGVGYETLYYRYFDNVDSAYAAAGAGIKIPLADRFGLKLETLYMLKHNTHRYDSNLAMMAGITYSFGKVASTTTAAVAAPVVAAAIVESDSDGDGVVDSKDKCPDTPIDSKVDAEGCIIDHDNDGVSNINDLCPETLTGIEVDATGCAKTLTINIQFPYDSNVVPAEKRAEIEKLARFLKNNPNFNIAIIGHTDSMGSNVYNLKLSKKRAEALKSALYDLGVEEPRMSVSGQGESSPIASNETEEGRTENRRLEIVFTQE